MAPNHHSSGTAVTPISHANEYVTSPAAIPPTLPPAGSGPFLRPGQYPPTGPSPAPPYTEHDLEVVGPNSKTPPPPYIESCLRVSVGDSKSFPLAYDLPFPSLALRPLHNSDEGGISPHIGASEEPSSLQLSNRDFAGHGTPSPAPVPDSTYCGLCAPASKHLNFHVNSNKIAYRWKKKDGSIPIGIDFSSFESRKQWTMVKKCLIKVLGDLKDKDIGPEFHFIDDPWDGAFLVSFKRDHTQYYATAFFPDFPPEHWQIYLFKPSLTLSGEQEDDLMSPEGEDLATTRLKAMERNLFSILSHEILHAVGLEHCVIDQNTETQPYVRFPTDLSDEDNWDPLMAASQNGRHLSQLDWKPRTLEHIRQIYDLNEGEKVGRCTIRDISWRDGMKVRNDMQSRICRRRGSDLGLRS